MSYLIWLSQKLCGTGRKNIFLHLLPRNRSSTSLNELPSIGTGNLIRGLCLLQRPFQHTLSGKTILPWAFLLVALRLLFPYMSSLLSAVRLVTVGIVSHGTIHSISVSEGILMPPFMLFTLGRQNLPLSSFTLGPTYNNYFHWKYGCWQI